MTQSAVGIEIETGGVLIKFVETAAENGGLLHAQEARYPPHSRPAPLHRHPLQDERFVVVEGQLKFRVGNADRIVKAGEAFEVTRGTVHSAYNPSAGSTLVVWETRPALRTGEFFAAMGRASQGRARPRLIDAAAILNEFRQEFMLANPPPLVQRVVFGCLAPFGRKAVGQVI